MLDKLRDKINEVKLDWMMADNKEKAIQVAKIATDAVILTSTGGQAVKTIKTATKLATCGYCHGAKAVASLTMNAQQKNFEKAGKKIIQAGGARLVLGMLDNQKQNGNVVVDNKNNYLRYYDTTKDVMGYKTVSREEECKDKVRARLLAGRWNMMDAVEFVEKELYNNVENAKNLAYQFVLNVKRENNIN